MGHSYRFRRGVEVENISKWMRFKKKKKVGKEREDGRFYYLLTLLIVSKHLGG